MPASSRSQTAGDSSAGGIVEAAAHAALAWHSSDGMSVTQGGGLPKQSTAGASEDEAF